MRRWLWLGIALDLLLLVPALVFVLPIAIAALESETSNAIAFGALFAFLPILCVAAPLSAWHAWGKDRKNYALTMLITPFIYGAYLLVFLWPL